MGIYRLELYVYRAVQLIECNSYAHLVSKAGSVIRIRLIAQPYMYVYINISAANRFFFIFY